MKTRLLMRVSAVFMAALGAAALFMPQEILLRYGAPDRGVLLLIVQAAGALYLGFAIMNWMLQGSLIGGIYNRPLALGNFLHFAVVALNLVKAAAAGPRIPEVLIAAVIYAVIALWFGAVLFTHPIATSTRET